MNNMEEKYSWARSPLKLQRAIANVKARVGPKPTEQDIKNLYIQYGGLLSKTDIDFQVEKAYDKLTKTMEEETKIESEITGTPMPEEMSVPTSTDDISM